MECLSKEAQMRVQDPITGDGRRVRQDDAERDSMHVKIAALQEENEAKQTDIVVGRANSVEKEDEGSWEDFSYNSSLIDLLRVG
ncbi:hypothetical protein L6452_41285 [Arctium lappa]|uniref:Uncharacterized protein n=1 Tax=Arctium lappa TaxID=4217 RepID=A0ACB8XPM5_ARCLA|nr:hypothetical protein L6452_41285 [Arctium lappa]